MSEYVIEVLFEKRRGCGFRKAGKDGVSLYLTGGVLSDVCPILPWPLHACPACGGGIKFARNWKWIIPEEIFASELAPTPQFVPSAAHIVRCPVCRPGMAMPKAGMMWVGEGYYPTPKEFFDEADAMGVCKRVPNVPRDIEFGKTWVYLAHNHAVVNFADKENPTSPGVFCVFRAARLDLVVDTDDVTKLTARAKNLYDAHKEHARLVHVIPVDDVQEQLI